MSKPHLDEKNWHNISSNTNNEQSISTNSEYNYLDYIIIIFTVFIDAIWLFIMEILSLLLIRRNLYIVVLLIAIGLIVYHAAKGTLPPEL